MAKTTGEWLLGVLEDSRQIPFAKQSQCEFRALSQRQATPARRQNFWAVALPVRPRSGRLDRRDGVHVRKDTPFRGAKRLKLCRSFSLTTSPHPRGGVRDRQPQQPPQRT